MFKEYDQYDALGLAALVKTSQIDPRELYEEACARLARVDPVLNATTCSMRPLAESLLKELDTKRVFSGVPFLVKDLMLPFAGFVMSNGSRAMRHYKPSRDSDMARHLNDLGLITLAKTNTSELGASSLTAPVAFGPTCNPWDLSRNAGGSSGGSSALVAARVVPMAYSSDGGGSIRLPASYCGIFGFKPSKGLNRYEDMSRAWGGAVVSHVSTLSVRDSAAYLDCVSNADMNVLDADEPPENSYLAALRREPQSLRIGLITQGPVPTPVHQECINAAHAAASVCEALGHRVEETTWNFDGMELMRAFLTIVFNYTHRDIQEMARLVGARYEKLDVELSTRFMAQVGSGVNDESVNRSLAVWEDVAQKMHALHERYDVILTPSVGTPPLGHTALDPNPIERGVMRLLLVSGLAKRIFNQKLLDSVIHKSIYQTPFTPIANMTGQPAMSVPLYWDAQGLPHGAHFMAARNQDARLFALARQLEVASPWRDKIPGVYAGKRTE